MVYVYNPLSTEIRNNKITPAIHRAKSNRRSSGWLQISVFAGELDKEFRTAYCIPL